MEDRSKIPGSSKWILQLLCKEEFIEEIIGDLHEYYEELHTLTPWKKRLFYWFHVMNFIRPWSLKKLEGNQQLNHFGMYKNFIISALRSVKRQRFFSGINILGLSVSIAISLMLLLFVNHELSYDGFHENGDRIYKVVSKMTRQKGGNWVTGITFGSVVPDAKKDIPEIELATRVYRDSRLDVIKDENNFQNNRLYYVDYDFFDIFSFKSVYGSGFTKQTFDNKGVVISKDLAELIFKNDSPVGETIRFSDDEYVILDVVEVPETSHLSFDLLISLENMDDLQTWSYNGGLEFHSYLLLSESSNAGIVGDKVAELYNGQMDERFSSFIASSDNYMMPFKDIHLKSEGISNNLATGSIKTIYILSGLNLLILIIAVVNYVNLTTAQYEKRIKEIGVRKVIGANRRALIFQFLGESVVLTLIAFSISLLLIQALIEPFGRLMEIPATVTFWTAPDQLALMLIAVICLGVLAGVYPALFISSFNPIKILKRDFLGFKKGTGASRVLVTLQFTIAIVLVINLVFLNKQIDFAKNKDLGFTKDQILVVNNLGDPHKKAYQSIAAEIGSYPNILSVTGGQSALGQGSSGQTVYLDGEDPNNQQSISEIRTMHNFINTHSIEIIKGRDFSPELVTDKEAFVLNKSAELMLFPEGEDPIGKVIHLGGRQGPIVGVVKDFHYGSLKRGINPLAISLDDPYRITLSIKLSPTNIQESLDNIEKTLQKVDSEYALNYYFLDDYFNDMFKAEERNAALISYSSLLAALISLVGLIGLINHSLAKKMKQMAIRKVLGAKFWGLLWVLAREFFLVIVIANLIALPIAIYAIGQWLESFAYRITPSDNWLLFAAISLLSFGLAFMLILSQVMKRTRANPAEVLANE